MNRPRQPEHASALLMTLVITSILGVSVASYMSLLGHQKEAVARSLSWNTAMPVLEAGIEEAMTHLNRNAGNLGRDGWTATGSACIGGVNLVGSLYTKSRSWDDQSFNVAIADGASPAIYAEGRIRTPLRNAIVSRTVEVRARTRTPYLGMVAKDGIDMNGQNVLADSYDSTFGPYTARPPRDEVTVASNGKIVGIISVGNANIYGYAMTGPGGDLTLGPGGGVGTRVWQAAHPGAIDESRVRHDMNMQFPDVADPFSSGYLTPSLSGGAYVLNAAGTNTYQLASLVKSLTVKSNTHAILKITSSINITGNDKITVENGASLQLYMAGTTAKIAGNGVANLGGDPLNFRYMGMPANTSLDLSGNAGVAAVVYAPNAALTLSGGGSTTLDFSGASVSKTVKLNGHFNFHYDERLGKTMNNGFEPIAWREI
jgi:hypothetical protein